MLKELAAWILVFIFWLAILGGGFLMFVVVFKSLRADFPLWRKCARSRKWPSVEGRMKSATVVVTRHVKSPTRSVAVKYEYHVDGVLYHGDRRLFEFTDNYSVRETDAIAARYAKGTTVNVFYDPQNPADCTLERTRHGVGSELAVSVVISFVGIIFAFIGGKGLVMMIGECYLHYSGRSG